MTRPFCQWKLLTGELDAIVLDTFLRSIYHSEMSETPNYRFTSPQEVATTLAFALRYEGRKRVNHADEIMAQITADRLVHYLAESGLS